MTFRCLTATNSLHLLTLPTSLSSLPLTLESTFPVGLYKSLTPPLLCTPCGSCGAVLNQSDFSRCSGTSPTLTFHTYHTCAANTGLTPVTVGTPVGGCSGNTERAHMSSGLAMPWTTWTRPLQPLLRPSLGVWGGAMSSSI